jgi:hypothetical protein
MWESGPSCNAPNCGRFRRPAQSPLRPLRARNAEHSKVRRVECLHVAPDGARRMFLFNLFETRSVPTSSSPLRWKGKPAESDVGMERFASLPRAVPPEISAAGLTTSDLSQ